MRDGPVRLGREGGVRPPSMPGGRAQGCVSLCGQLVARGGEAPSMPGGRAQGGVQHAETGLDQGPRHLTGARKCGKVQPVSTKQLRPRALESRMSHPGKGVEQRDRSEAAGHPRVSRTRTADRIALVAWILRTVRPGGEHVG
jgi:hypothetical protein